MDFFLGTDMPNWLAREDVPLFVSRRRLVRYKKTLPRARVPWALDSGGFTELSLHGCWTVTAARYAAEATRFALEIGRMVLAAPMDWMCEPVIRDGDGKKIPGTHLSVREHQRRTVNNLRELRSLAPSVPWIPVLQGWEYGDYLRHVEDYGRAGIDLRTEPRVGLGSVCRRQGTGMVESLIRELSGMGIRLHGFGFKIDGLRRVAPFLASSDSMAWSFHARKDNLRMDGCEHKAKDCRHCRRWALLWREKVLRTIRRAEEARQLTLW